MKKYTLSEFINISNSIFNNFYDYTKISNFKNLSSVITIICPIHGPFDQTAQFHIQGHKCKKCGYEIAANKHRKHPKDYIRYIPNGTIAKTLDDYIVRFSKKYNNKYDYSLLTQSDFEERRKTKGKNIIKIICPNHGIFEQKFNYHGSGNGCQKCKADISKNTRMILNIPNKLTTEKFIKKSNKIHHKFYDYSLVDIKSSNKFVTIICPRHGKFEQIAKYHLDGSGCRECAKGKTSSKIARQWLESFNNPNIILEYKINGFGPKGFIVDGYDPITNTVYEFLGDYWHGNPTVFNSDKLMTKMNKTFGELYNDTIRRLNYIVSQGYILIFIWENDWIKQSKFTCI